MAIYTTLNKKKIKSLISKYNVGTVLDFSVLSGGSANSSYRLITTEGQFVLTICDEKNLQEVKVLVNLLSYLEKKNFQTTKIIKSKSHETITWFENKPVILKQFISGNVFDEIDLGMLNELGKEIARLHTIPAPNFLPKSAPYGMKFFPEIFESEYNPHYTEWLKEKYEYFTEKIPPDLPRGLIHGDVFYDNVLFTPDKNLAAIIDFEEACNYYKIFDIAMCIVGTCALKRSISLKKAKSLVSGYQIIRKLEDMEQRALIIFVEYAAVATSFWRFRQYNIFKPDPEKSNRFEEMKNIANKIHSINNDEFREAIFN